jgi:hypothetical protein
VTLPKPVEQVRDAVSAYEGNEYVYLIRNMAAIVRCEQWTFDAEKIRVECDLCRVVFGDNWPSSHWDFGVSARQGDFLFQNKKLQGANLSDTIVIDQQLFRLALNVFPDSEPTTIDKLKTVLRRRA